MLLSYTAALRELHDRGGLRMSILEFDLLVGYAEASAIRPGCALSACGAGG